jgi:adenosylcobinamide-GDP ribazoletransferase
MRSLTTRALHELRLAFVALQFLTRVPVPSWVGFDPAWLQSCLRHFPLVGAAVGVFAAAVLGSALALWPPGVAATLSVLATVWLTGAFHEDGLADTCDGLGGSVSRERALAIMKDSRIGSYGAVGLVLALVLKVTVVAALAASGTALAGSTTALAASGPWAAIGTSPLSAAAALIWGHAVSRAAPVLLVWRLPYAGDVEHAKAKPLATRIGGGGVVVALGWLVVLAAAMLLYRPGLLGPLTAAIVAGMLATLWCARWLRRRLGGFTGDTLGATQQIVELAVLLAWLAWSARVAGGHALGGAA